MISKAREQVILFSLSTGLAEAVLVRTPCVVNVDNRPFMGWNGSST